MDTKNLILKYKKELLHSVVPFWEKNAIDNQKGGFFTFLDRNGSVYDTEKYMWMQWRIVYMFSELYRTSFSQSKWIKIAERGYDFLVNHGKTQKGDYYFALNRDGVPSVVPYNLYSNCFAAMGAASLYQSTGEKKYKIEAESSTKRYLSRLNNPKGKWNKLLSGRSQRLNLGYYMMFVNMGIIMKEALSTKKFDSQIESSIDLVLNKFWNKKFGVLFENITTDYRFDLKSCEGRHINPGHGLEALWFILKYAETYNKDNIIKKVLFMINSILEFGWDKENGGIFYFMDVLGKPKIELEWDMKLWWVHNEAIIASLYAHYLSGDSVFEKWFKKLNDWTWKRFPDKKYGEWYGYLNRQGNPSILAKGGKWKTFFHLPRFLLQSIDLFEKIEKMNRRKL